MCGEQKSKKDDKTASTPLVTVSDLQRMKQFEVIILRMRKQPFKTKFTPYFKLDWGRNYPPAKYPTRPKRPLHTFDIKEFVKSQKKKKLLEMMNSTDEDNKKDDLSMPAIPGIPRPNPFGGDDLPEELRKPRERSEVNIPDFLTRKPVESKEESSLPKIPDFETFKKQMEANAFGAFEDEEIVPPKKAEPVVAPAPSKNVVEEDDDDDDDLGFDVDELVKKIDAKIAELEAEEKRNKEKEEAEKKAASIPSVTSSPLSTIEKLPDDIIEEEYIPRFKENIEENFVSKPITPPVQERTVEVKPTNVNINLDDDSEDDDFFDDFFDNLRGGVL